MKMVNIRKLLIGILVIFIVPAVAQTLKNPVLRNVADAGCIRYAGKYYLGGVGTDGDFFVSPNLTDWKKRIHVFDLDNQWTHGTGARNNQIHADDISYSNGLFHLLFSANYWGDDAFIVHIVHATSPKAEGPYREVRNDQWFENRIDPHVFCDEDGSLYLYMVKFTDGNTIWGRAMNSDFTFKGDAVEQFSSLPETWETCDNRVAEGPFVMKYHGRYYMMYNANHTAGEYGNYHLGVCEATSPLAFNNGGKYSYPVVCPNTERVAEQYTDLLRYGSIGYNVVDMNSREMHFALDKIPEGNVYLLLGNTEACKLSINGYDVCECKHAEYTYYPVRNDYLKVGDNVLTVEEGSGGVCHLYLYSMGGDTPEEVMVTPGQPNIVRGPNGWEWWLVYMANQGWGRHQFVDRIHFVNNRLTVDGISSAGSKQYHPVPALPQYAGHSLDSVPESACYLLELTFSDTSKHQGVRIGNCKVLLPDSMKRGVCHEWRIEKNFGMMTVWIDRILVADHIDVSEKSVKAKWIGNEKMRKVEYISFCEGFDEYGCHFSGWGKMLAKDDGIHIDKACSCFKPMAATDYSMSVQFSNPSIGKGKYGVYAAYINEQNYVRVVIDAAAYALVIEKMEQGKLTVTSVPLTEMRVHYPDIKYTDFVESQYHFDSPTCVSSVSYTHVYALNECNAANMSVSKQREELTYIDDVASRKTLEYLDGDTWKSIAYEEVESANKAWQQVCFPAVKTCALRLINKNARDYGRYVYRLKTTRDFQTDYQLRIEKHSGCMHIYLGEREMSEIPVTTEPTRVGLYSDGKTEVTVGNVLYYVIN